MLKAEWILFIGCFLLSEILIRKNMKIHTALRGFSGGILISLVCFWLIPVNFSSEILLCAGMMIAGIFCGEMLTLNDACDLALWFMAAVFIILGGLINAVFLAAGGGLLLYIGCKMSLPENLGMSLNIISRASAAAGFIFALFMNFFIVQG